MQKILIVDDDNTLRAALTRYLQDRGFVVHNATSGLEGFDSFIEDTPELIVSDVMMPEMDGFELCTKIRGTDSGRLVPFIFLSGRCDLEDRIQGHILGADDYLVKPFHPRELIAKIEAQLARSSRIHAEIQRVAQQSSSAVPADQPLLPLTPAEEKVFWEVIQGYTNKTIGDRLFISPRTVQTHLRSILSKLSVENRARLIRFAFENGYMHPRPASHSASHSANQLASHSANQPASWKNAQPMAKKAARKAKDQANSKTVEEGSSKIEDSGK